MRRSIAVHSRALTLLCTGYIAGCSGGGGGGDGGSGSSISAPTGLSYPSFVEATVDTAIAPLAPTVVGNVSTYTIAPPLPAGLVLDPTTGVISGSPYSPAGQATYTISASNSAGTTTFELVLTVVLPGLVWDSGAWDRGVWQ